jgi:hypothetical protein
VKVLIACEYSGIVRDAFIERGHDAISCDLLPTDRQARPHHQGDVLDLLGEGWDMMIAFPPCTYVCSSGLHHLKHDPARIAETEKACDFFCALLGADIPRIAIENPVGILSRRVRKPDQIIHPWQFGEDASKTTCLWLAGLPPLTPTDVLPGDRFTRRGNQTASGQNKVQRTADRWKIRSTTYQGIANAMAAQWSDPDALSLYRVRRLQYSLPFLQLKP